MGSNSSTIARRRGSLAVVSNSTSSSTASSTGVYTCLKPFSYAEITIFRTSVPFFYFLFYFFSVLHDLLYNPRYTDKSTILPKTS